MLYSIGRVFPCHIVTIRLGDHISATRLAAIGNQGLINLFHLIIFLGSRQLVSHLLKDGITFGCLSEGIIINSLGEEQVVLHFIITSCGSIVLHGPEMIGSRCATSHFHIHLIAFFRYEIVQRSSAHSILHLGIDGLIDTTKQIEGFIIVIFLIEERIGLDSAFYALLHLPLIGIVLESENIVITSKSHMFAGKVRLCLLLKFTLLRIN